MWLRFSSEAARLLVREHGLNSPDRLRVLTDNNVNDICNVVRKSGSKNANRTRQRAACSVIAQKNLKLAVIPS